MRGVVVGISRPESVVGSLDIADRKFHAATPELPDNSASECIEGGQPVMPGMADSESIDQPASLAGSQRLDDRGEVLFASRRRMSGLVEQHHLRRQVGSVRLRQPAQA